MLLSFRSLTRHVLVLVDSVRSGRGFSDVDVRSGVWCLFKRFSCWLDLVISGSALRDAIRTHFPSQSLNF